MGKANEIPSTDLRRWRLSTNRGAFRWTYYPDEKSAEREQNFAEKFFLGLPNDSPRLPVPNTFHDVAVNGLKFFAQLQLDEGLWACDYGGPSFLLPGLVFALYISGCKIESEWKTEIIRYISSIANEDAGWGLHSEDETNVFGTTLYYIVLRILGMSADHAVATKARKRLLALGGAIGNPQWGKHWLSCLNLYDWSGVNPVPSELWCLPDWMPAHPHKWWVQCRVVFLPTSYLWANKCSMPLNPLLQELRQEIYVEEWSTIRFASCRNLVAPSDLNRHMSVGMQLANSVLQVWSDYFRPSWLHRYANKVTLDLIRRENENTSYNCLAPVNKAFHMVAEHFAGDTEAVARHAEKLPTYLWLGDKGMTSGGTNGVQLWDTAFAAIAIVEAGLGEHTEFRPLLEKALHYLDISQFRDNLSDPYRQQRKGGWPFSTHDNSYIVSDCSAEGLKAVLLLQEECAIPALLKQSRLEDCVDTLLTMQNRDGGFGSYEPARGGAWMEKLNPGETFDRIMVEYSYPECTTAVLTALALFRQYYSDYRRDEIEQTIQAAAKFIENDQRADGSWYGSWAICFTYASFFALEALCVVGQVYDNSSRVRKACDFLVSKQKSDGGWGEHHSSCVKKEYIDNPQSQIVNTAWACLALMSARYPDTEVVRRGLEVIKSRQLDTGEWRQEAVEGVFNRTCMIGYPNYRFYFSIRALGKWEHDYLPSLKSSMSQKVH